VLRYTYIACPVCDLSHIYIHVGWRIKKAVHMHTHIAVRSDAHKTKHNATCPLLRLIVTSYDHVARESRQMRGFIAAPLEPLQA
jgi:hypothetical protein